MLFLLLILFSIFPIQSMDTAQSKTGIIIGDAKDEPFLYAEKNLSLMGHIIRSTYDKTHPFSANSIFRFHEDQNEFEKLGTVSDYKLQHQDRNDINSGNWIFTHFYTNAKTHLSSNMYIEIGALIFGTRNPEMADHLFEATIQSRTKQLHIAEN